MSIKERIKNNPKMYALAEKALIYKRVILNMPRMPWYFRCRSQFTKEQKTMKKGHKFSEILFYPILGDKDADAGSAGMYLVQDLWAAQKIYQLPREHTHYDIGSRVDGFITHLLSFRDDVTLIDIRPLPYFIDGGLSFIQADATNLTTIEDSSVYSLSALCSLEHFGLGRYGDPIDSQACFKAFNAIQRVVAPGGRAYISVPIGRERIEFNAHRIFYPTTIIKCFSDMKLVEFSVATNNKKTPLIKNADINGYDKEEHLFGLFEFVKEY